MGHFARLAGTAAFAAATLASASASAQTTVTMWTFLDPQRTSPREVALKQMIEEFEKANPSIKIKVEPQDFAQMPPRFYLGHRTGQNPDVVWIDAKNLGGLLQSDAGADLNQAIVAKWPASQRDDFFVGAGWNAAKQGNKLLAMPLFHGASVIYYRKDLLKEAGIDPASLKSWQAIADAAKKLTKTKDGRTDVWGFGMPLAPTKTESTPLLIGMIDAGGSIFNGCKANFATEAGVRGLKYTAEMITQVKATPQEALAQHVDDITDQFMAGRYAIAITSNLRFSAIAKGATFGGDNVGIIPWPTWSGQGTGPMPVSGWWVAMWNKSPRQAEAAKFVDFMTGPEGVRLWSVVGGQVPTRKSVLVRAQLDRADGVQHAHAADRAQRGGASRGAQQRQPDGRAQGSREEVQRRAVTGEGGAVPAGPAPSAKRKEAESGGHESRGQDGTGDGRGGRHGSRHIAAVRTGRLERLRRRHQRCCSREDGGRNPCGGRQSDRRGARRDQARRGLCCGWKDR
jgi:multiple sugar transport system substrate-binding protein